MRRLLLRWLGLLVFVVVLGGVFVRLGEWQLHRLEQRKEANATVVAHENNPVIPLSQRGYEPVLDGDQWQRVTVTGTFDAAHQLEVRYRSNDGATGTEVVLPLRTSDGHLVLVDRGFIVRAAGQAPPETLPAPPTGTVTVVGHLRRSENGSSEAVTPALGAVRLINGPAIGTWLGTPVMDGYIGLLQVTPAQDGPFVPVATPTLDEGPHFWYAVQWFMFTGIALTGLIVFIRGDIVARRKARAAAAARAATSREASPADAPHEQSTVDSVAGDERP
ncbi:MAG TPA: SURF1 family protein [Propionibacteriaceae bacterium]|nr:SURF1 family protein [Propionibacteriaceae bacterium]